MNRKEILQQLSDGAISREEAERQLAELGSPVPSELSAPPTPPGTNKGASGCLVAALITGVVLLVLLGLLFAGLFFVRGSYDDTNNSHMQAVEQEFEKAIQQQSGSEISEYMELNVEKESE